MALSNTWNMTDNIYNRDNGKKAYKALRLKCPCCKMPLGVLPTEDLRYGTNRTTYVVCCGKNYHDASLVAMEAVPVLAYSEEEAFLIANRK